MGYLSNFSQVRINAATFTRTVLSPKCSCSYQQTSTSVNPLLLTSASRFPQRNSKGVSPHWSLHLTYNIVLLKRVLTVSGLDTADLRLVWFQNATCMLYLELSYLLLSASFWWSLGKCTLPTWNPDRFYVPQARAARPMVRMDDQPMTSCQSCADGLPVSAETSVSTWRLALSTLEQGVEIFSGPRQETLVCRVSQLAYQERPVVTNVWLKLLFESHCFFVIQV